MADYVKLAATAKRLIEANGRPVVFRRLGAQVTDPAKPWRASENVRNPADLEVTALAVFVDPVSAAKMGLGLNSESELMKTITAVALVAAESSPEDLETCHEVVELGTILSIEHIEVLKPGTLKLLYIFLLKSMGASPTVIQNSAFTNGFNTGYN